MVRKGGPRRPSGSRDEETVRVVNRLLVQRPVSVDFGRSVPQRRMQAAGRLLSKPPHLASAVDPHLKALLLQWQHTRDTCCRLSSEHPAPATVQLDITQLRKVAAIRGLVGDSVRVSYISLGLQTCSYGKADAAAVGGPRCMRVLC